MKLFVVHGWTYSLDAWRELESVLQAHKIEVVFLKVPGLTSPSDKVWTMNDYAEWLHKSIERKKPAYVIGHSNGGRIGLACAAAYPQSIKHLILLDSAGAPRRQPTRSIKRSFFKVIAKLAGPFIKGKLRRRLYRLIGAADYGNASPTMKQTMQHMLAADGNIALEKIACPVTIIWGENDTITPPVDAQWLAERLATSSPVHIIKGARHSPQATHPHQVAQIIESVIKGSGT